MQPSAQFGAAQTGQNDSTQLRIRHDSTRGLQNVLRQARRLGTYARVWCGSRTGRRTLCGPLWAQVGPVGPCNYACRFCVIHSHDAPVHKLDRANRARALFPLDVARRLARDLERMGTLTVDLIGKGEPLLHPDKMELIDAFRRHRLEVNMYTNGALLDRATARELVQLGLRNLRLSVNAASGPTHKQISGGKDGDFDEILRGAAAVAEFRRRSGRPTPYMVYSFVLMEANYREAATAVQHAARIGIDAVYFKPLLRDHVSHCYAPFDQAAVEQSLQQAGAEAGRLGVHTNLELREEFPLEKDFRTASSQVFSRWPCYFPWLFTMIENDGVVRGCCQCENDLGNVYERDFTELWTAKPYRDFRRACRLLPQRGPMDKCPCNNCLHAARNGLFHCMVHPLGSREAGPEAPVGSLLSLRRLRMILNMLRFKYL
jgi:MoaA/NifB/PqqE/SkfB family radical SAM enzyme